MKYRIFLTVFGPSILFLALIIFKYFFSAFSYSTWFFVVAFLSTFFRALLTKKKYLVAITIIGKELTIQYLTQFLKLEYFSVNTIQIENIEYLKRNWFFEECDVITIKANKEWFSFQLLGPKSKTDIKAEIPIINQIILENNRTP